MDITLEMCQTFLTFYNLNYDKIKNDITDRDNTDH